MFHDAGNVMTDEKIEPLPTVTRSPELMNPADTGLLVIDVQEKLIAVQPEGERVTWNVRRSAGRS